MTEPDTVKGPLPSLEQLAELDAHLDGFGVREAWHLLDHDLEYQAFKHGSPVQGRFKAFALGSGQGLLGEGYGFQVAMVPRDEHPDPRHVAEYLELLDPETARALLRLIKVFLKAVQECSCAPGTKVTKEGVCASCVARERITEAYGEKDVEP